MQRIRIAALLLGLVLLAGAAAGCAAPPAEEGKLWVTATVFPLYDWARNIAGDAARVTLLVDGGVDTHSFQPAASDMVTVKTCGLLLYVGGESEAWVEEALADRQGPGVDMLQTLGDAALKEELLPGMQGEPEEGYDEHIWLSLKNARYLCKAIADAMAAADPENASLYRANAGEYMNTLAALDEAYAAAVAAAPRKTLVIADRFPFRYLAADYGLDCYAAFAGCSAETGASFATVIGLARRAEEAEVPVILQLESADGSLARAVRDATETKAQKILTLDSLQSAREDADYLSAMRQNLTVLQEALA